jgi:hypothetical protein
LASPAVTDTAPEQMPETTEIQTSRSAVVSCVAQAANGRLMSRA